MKSYKSGFIILIISCLLNLEAQARKKDAPQWDKENECSHNYAALAFDFDRGTILHQKRAQELRFPASLTKVMTLFLTFDAIKAGKISLDQQLPISQRAAAQPRSNIELEYQDTIKTKDAIISLIVKSANDSAVVLAEAVGETEWNFARMMNKKAKKLGMKFSNFRNASGLHDEGQVTNAYDMAKMALAIKEKHPNFYPLFALTQFKHNDKVYESHNHFLREYKGALGMKTGYTMASGFNLISNAKRGNKNIASILMSCASHEERDALAKKIADQTFQSLKKIGNKKPHHASFVAFK